MWRAIERKIGAARRQPWEVLLLAPVAWAAIGVAALVILCRPFRRIAPRLGRNHGPVALVPLADSRQEAQADIIARAIGIAASNAPFRSNCLPQAMAAVWLCRRRGVPYAMHLGVVADPDSRAQRLKAHAWVECGAETITGGRNSYRRYGTVACFVGPDGPGTAR